VREREREREREKENPALEWQPCDTNERKRGREGESLREGRGERNLLLDRNFRKER